MPEMNRRSFVRAGAAAGLVTITRRHDRDEVSKGMASQMNELTHTSAPSRMVTIDAKPAPIDIDVSKTALIVVDMQNDFGAEGGMMHRAGIDISGIRAVIEPLANVLTTTRDAGIKTVYLKMGFRPDLSDLGAATSPNRVRHLAFGVGKTIRAPKGAESRLLIRDTWNTDILPELAPRPDDIVIYKTRYSGFYQTRLDATLKELGVIHLIFAGCTTSICVESTVRDAMFRDYSAVVLADCVAEPIGHDLPRSNHEASLLIFEVMGWVSRSEAFISAVGTGAHAGKESR